MAMSSAIVYEIRTTATASNANGGGFKTGASGTDFSQQDAAQYNLTGVTTAAADAILLSASAAADMVGNVAHITSGTNFTVGWYEIISVVAGVSITLDRNCTSAAGAGGVVNIGGAMSLASTLDDDLFEAAVAGNIFYVKAGTYTFGEAISVGAAGGASNPIKIIGYSTTRGDNPTGSTRPVFAQGATSVVFGANWDMYNIKGTGTGAAVGNLNTNSKAVNCLFINSSTTVDRTAITCSPDNLVMRCELISYRGRALFTGAGVRALYNYIHDSDVGIRHAVTSIVAIIGNIIADNVTRGIDIQAALTTGNVIASNTLYGAENKRGTGINFITGVTDVTVVNNTISGFVTGITHADTQSVGFDDYNNFFNNTNDVSAAGQWQKGSNDIAVDPSFTTMAQLTGTTATTSGSVLTQSGGDFSTVTDNVDFLYLVSGTGITVGKYLITTHTATTVTLDIAPGTNATADKVWQITTGHNFLPTGSI